AHDAVAGIDEHDGEIGRGCARRHVSRVLFMAGRIGDDELALWRREEAIRDVDGDALLALSLEPIHEQCEVDLVAARAMPPRIALERSELVLEDQPGVVEQPADQGGLAIVDGTAGEEAQEGAAVVLIKNRADVETLLEA